MTKATTKLVSKTQAKPANPSVTPISNRKEDNQSVMTRWLRQQRVFGYLHSVREIPNSFPKKIGATISVPQGEVRDWETFQVVVNFFDAHMLFNEYKCAVEDKETNVTVWFDVTNIKSKHYIVQEGDKKGEVVDYWSCTLNNLSSMSVDGNVVYSQDEKVSISSEQYYSEHK
jgi:hypothetical protein